MSEPSVFKMWTAYFASLTALVTSVSLNPRSFPTFGNSLAKLSYQAVRPARSVGKSDLLIGVTLLRIVVPDSTEGRQFGRSDKSAVTSDKSKNPVLFISSLVTCQLSL